jgi:hypothetical protein
MQSVLVCTGINLETCRENLINNESHRNCGRAVLIAGIVTGTRVATLSMFTYVIAYCDDRLLR